MKKRQWSSNEKFKIVMEGLSEKIEVSKLLSKISDITESILQMAGSCFEIWALGLRDKKYYQERKKVN